MGDKITQKNLNFSINKELLKEVAFLIGLCHDLGKATSYFQDYLYAIQHQQENNTQQEYKQHSLLSALFGYILVEDYIKGIKEGNKLLKYLPSISWIIIKRHHGDLDDIFKEFDYSMYEIDKAKEIIKIQFNAMNLEEISEILKPYTELKIDEDILTSLLKVLDEITEEEDRFLDYQEEESYELFILSKFLFSALISSDKYDAIFHQREEIFPITIEDCLVDSYKILKRFDQKDSVNKIREKVYKDVIGSIQKLGNKNKIMSITLPTGTGKTLTAVSAALKLRQRLLKETGRSYKVIYTLPFTSIIDQNYSVLEEMFKKVQGEKPTNNVLLKHHYLSDLHYSMKSPDEMLQINESRYMIENWKSQIIVTTFVQFFHSIFSNRNTALGKYSNIANTIIILDEIQSIHHKYWEIINNLFKAMASYLDIYFILVTATQPLIFIKEKNEVVELAKDSEEYFSLFNRTRLHLNIRESLSMEEFLDVLMNLIEDNPQKDLLIVMNTIKSSLEVYDYITKLELQKTELYYLSTNIIPKDRKTRINAIKEEREFRKVIVSTQLIEAGVDIDVDIVIRDFAPLDAINQVAGRCNRNGKKQQSDVYIFRLNNGHKEFHQYIYDPILISKTLDILIPYNIIEEKDFYKIAQAYFQLVKNHKSKDTSKKLLENIYKVEHRKANESFKLIEQDYEKVDVFIELDEKAKGIWNQFQRLKEIKDPIQRKNQFYQFKKEFYDYVISINKEKFLKELDGFCGYISYEELEGAYDKETGYKLIDEMIVF